MPNAKYFVLFVGFVALLFCGISVAQGNMGSLSGLPEGGAEDEPAAALGDEDRSNQETQKEEADEADESSRPKTYQDMVDEWMTPIQVEKKFVKRAEGDLAYPHPAIPFKMRIVDEDETHYWMVGLSPENPESALHKLWLQGQETEILILTKQEVDKRFGPGRFLDFSEPVVPPPTIRALEFKSAGGGLPVNGKWQMGFDVADMNGDGELDLVLPPPRLGQPAQPSVYLGDGTGDFSYWKEVRWPNNVPFDYGDIKVADFDADGNLDIVLAIHFKGQYVLYGSGNHVFERAVKLPTPDPRITSRATTVADFDGDGRLDLAFIAEIDLDMNENRRLKNQQTVWIVRNTRNGWRVPDYEGLPKYVIGDGLRAQDVDGDGKQDLVLSSTSSAWRALVLLNRLPEEFEFWDEKKILGGSFHFGVRPYSDEGNGARSAVYATFQQYFRTPKGKKVRTGIVKYAPGVDAHDWKSVDSNVIVVDDERYNYHFRLAVGDLNNDGFEDLVVSRKKGGIEVWVQTSDGMFFKNTGSDLDAKARVYDLRIVDLNGDGFGDVVAALSDLEQHAGGVRVWMTRSAE